MSAQSTASTLPPLGTGKHSQYLGIIALIATFGGLLFGYDTGVVNGALEPLTQDFGLTPRTEGIVVSFLTIGAAFGAVIGGRLSDAYGRRMVLVITAALFTLAPIGAMGNLLKKTGWSKDEIDLFEINEAFAMVTMLAMREHGLDHAKVNVFGGACAQGHPVGSTGSRIILTLINALQKKGGKRGIASLCIGGGEATAVAIELL